MSRKARTKANAEMAVRAGRLARQGKAPESIAAYQQALRHDPGNPEFHNNLGVMLTKERRFEEAARHFELAVFHKDDYPEAHRNLGAVLTMLRHLDRGLYHFQMALKFRPRYAEAHSGIGVIREIQGRHEEAILAYDMALMLNTAYAEAHRNRAYIRLLLGEFQRGWSEYSWRWKCNDASYGTVFTNEWQGEDLTGKIIFLNSEQGLGDTIHFFRYVPMVRARGPKRLMFVTDSSLIPLFERSAPGLVDEYVPYGLHKMTFDYGVSLINLANVFKTDLETIPRNVPYLKARPECVSYWREFLPSRGLNVGIKWRGSNQHGRDRDRSFSVHMFKPLLEIRGANFFSLQTGPEASELLTMPNYRVGDWGSQFDMTTFEDAAAACMALDLIISVDTSLVHLSGALGRPTWNLITYSPDWRWLLNRNDTPWYPTMRLFRQPRYGDWESVIADVADALRANLR